MFISPVIMTEAGMITTGTAIVTGIVDGAAEGAIMSMITGAATTGAAIMNREEITPDGIVIITTGSVVPTDINGQLCRDDKTGIVTAIFFDHTTTKTGRAIMKIPQSAKNIIIGTSFAAAAAGMMGCEVRSYHGGTYPAPVTPSPGAYEVIPAPPPQVIYPPDRGGDYHGGRHERRPRRHSTHGLQPVMNASGVVIGYCPTSTIVADQEKDVGGAGPLRLKKFKPICFNPRTGEKSAIITNIHPR